MKNANLFFFFADEIKIHLDEFKCKGVVEYSISPGNQSGYFCAENFGMCLQKSHSFKWTDYLNQRPGSDLVTLYNWIRV